MTSDHVGELLSAATEARGTFGYTYVPSDLNSMATYVEQALEAQRSGTQTPYVTRDLRTGRVVGATRFYDLEYWDWSHSLPSSHVERTRPGPDTVSIGHTWLAPSAQRSPINTEAKLMMLTHAFETWHVRTVRLQTDARNERSRRAIERIGCRLDGIIRAERPAIDGTVRDTALFSLLSSEWPAVSDRLRARLGDR